MSNEHKWMSSGFLQGAPTGEVSAEKGVIEGVSVCTVGEAKGHGVNLDSEFIESVRDFGNEKKQGLKARFGHPNMCSTALGTFIGRFKNFDIDGEQVKADLFLSNESKQTPQGDLHSYVMGMATNEPDMFGTSIVFTPGRTYVRPDDGEKVYDYYEIIHDRRFTKDEYKDLPVFVECESLHACDAVDNPAANDGLFSAFTGETIGGQITEFLDLNPQVWDALESQPSILEALARYGDKMDEFTQRYRAYREHSKEVITMTDKKVQAESGAEAEAAALAAKEAEENEAALTAKADEDAKVATELAAKEEAEKATELAAKKDEPVVPVEALSRDECQRINDEFGADVLATVVLEGGDYQTALAASHAALNAEIEDLRTKLAAKSGGGTAVKVVASEGKKEGLFKTGA